MLSLLAEDYIVSRFPRLPSDSRELALQVYTTDRNLCAVARSMGIEYAVIDFTGIPRTQLPALEAHCNRRGREADGGESPVKAIHPTVIYAEIFRALVGVLFVERVPHQAGIFVSSPTSLSNPSTCRGHWQPGASWTASCSVAPLTRTSSASHAIPCSSWPRPS